jgi:phage N-6-adenine-methyltransferase
MAESIIWSTPQPIFDALDKEFHFVIDLCADKGNAKCKRYLDRRRSLNESWDGDGYGFLNPPYGRDIADWVEKAATAHRYIVGFLPGRTNAPWWHNYVMQATEIRFVKRKVSFANEHGCKGVPPWGAIVAVWQWDAPIPLSVSSWDWRDS